MIPVLWHVLGTDYGLPYGHFGWYSLWSGFLGVGVLSAVGGLIHRHGRRMDRNHRELLAQNAQHHREKLAQDAEHHKAHLELLRRHHQQVLDAQATPVIVQATPAQPAEKVAAETVKQIRRQRAANPGGGI